MSMPMMLPPIRRVARALVVLIVAVAGGYALGNSMSAILTDRFPPVRDEKARFFRPEEVARDLEWARNVAAAPLEELKRQSLKFITVIGIHGADEPILAGLARLDRAAQSQVDGGRGLRERILGLYDLLEVRTGVVLTREDLLIETARQCADAPIEKLVGTAPSFLWIFYLVEPDKTLCRGLFRLCDYE